jgi:hypothetical protein
VSLSYETIKSLAVSELIAIKQTSDRFDSAWQILRELLGASPECPIFEAYYKMQSIALDYWSQKHGVPLENTHWFVYDNNWGLKKLGVLQLGALHSAAMIPITDVESFVNYELSHSDSKQHLSTKDTLRENLA